MPDKRGIGCRRAIFDQFPSGNSSNQKKLASRWLTGSLLSSADDRRGFMQSGALRPRRRTAAIARHSNEAPESNALEGDRLVGIVNIDVETEG